MSETPDFGQIAYEGYVQNSPEGRQMPSWRDMPEARKVAWRAVANAVVERFIEVSDL